MATLLTRMLKGEIPCHILLETADYAAMLEPKPLTRGHAVVLPKREVDALFNLDDAALAGLTVFAKKIAKALKEIIPCRKIALVAYGLQVPHAHLHLIPAHGHAGELDLSKPRAEADQKELAELAGAIRAAF